MRYSISAVVFVIGLLGAASARAELDEIALLNAEAQTAICARYHQLFAAYELEFLVPDLRATVLARVGEQGASEAQRAQIERLYDETRARSAEAGLAPASRKAELNRGRLAILESEADTVLAFCDRRVFALTHVRPAPEEPGIEQGNMWRFRKLVDECGWSALFSSRYGFDELYPDFREVTLNNVRRHGANEAQVQVLNQTFDAGVQRGKESWQGDEIELLVLTEEDGREYMLNVYSQTYQRCATENLFKD